MHQVMQLRHVAQASHEKKADRMTTVQGGEDEENEATSDGVCGLLADKDRHERTNMILPTGNEGFITHSRTKKSKRSTQV